MNQREAFTLRHDERGVVLSFDDGENRIYDADTADAILSALKMKPSSATAFSASALAGFADAAQATPHPATAGPLLDRAVRGRESGGSGIALGHLTHERTGPFAGVLANRRSNRDLGPVGLTDMATLLVRCARVLNWSYDERGVEVSLRPHPSAGATHPLTIDLIAKQVVGLDEGCWTFDPFRCEIVRSSTTADEVDRAAEVISAASSPTFPAALVLLANPGRTLARYPRGVAHLWRDAGALLATLHLAATDLGLGSSIVGTSGALVRFDPEGNSLVDVGSLIVGGVIPA